VEFVNTNKIAFRQYFRPVSGRRSHRRALFQARAQESFIAILRIGCEVLMIPARQCSTAPLSRHQFIVGDARAKGLSGIFRTGGSGRCAQTPRSRAAAA
jgi:hypothetical protein